MSDRGKQSGRRKRDGVIRIDNLSKKYVLSHQEKRRSYKTFREAVSKKATFLRKSLAQHAAPDVKHSTREDFWALNDVSFDVGQGERVGIIGRNGAGKSTLLKILSRITEPTRGRLVIRGRVASLLEVGTGFHPELTGRENVLLNGAILGMRREEIRRKFDEIVAFAEVERFLDTPVKRYSSGMYVRLAFAVAAHLEPEILIVDEVLAVGDARFQKKCLGKMAEAGQAGRTVLFVSHNMSTIQSLCSRCVLLKNGQVSADGPSASVVQRYLQDATASHSFVRTGPKNGKAAITSGSLLFDPETKQQLIRIELEVFSESRQQVALELRLLDGVGSSVGFGDIGRSQPHNLVSLRPGVNALAIALPIHQLALGAYFISLDLTVPMVEYLDRLESCLFFEVTRAPSKDSFTVISQQDGFGSVEFPLEIIRQSHRGEASQLISAAVT